VVNCYIFEENDTEKPVFSRTLENALEVSDFSGGG